MAKHQCTAAVPSNNRLTINAFDRTTNTSDRDDAAPPVAADACATYAFPIS